MSPRKYIPLIIVALLLSAALLFQFANSPIWPQSDAGSGESPVQPAGGGQLPEKSVELFVTVSLPVDQYTRLVQKTRMFMSEYSHIQVHIHNEEESSDSFAEWTMLGQLGATPDVLLMENNWIAPFAVKGYLKPVDSIMSGDALSDQLAGVLEPLRWNGYLWGVPKDLNPHVLLWHSELLNAAGLDGPPADWNAFMEAADRLAGLDEEALLVNFSPGDMRQLFLWTDRFYAGADSWMRLLRPTEEQTEMLLDMYGLGDKAAALPLSDIAALSEWIAEDKLLSIIIPWDIYEQLDNATKERLVLDEAALLQPWLEGRSFAIGASSDAEEEAMLWIQEITEAAYQRTEYNWSKRLPARASLYEPFAGSEAGGSGDVPPVWWGERLNTKLTEEQLLYAGPSREARWREWERLWRMHSSEGLQLDSFARALSELSDARWQRFDRPQL